jgi:LacI family transcriptional regulator
LQDYGTASDTCQEVVDAAKAMDELLAHAGERPTAVVAGNDPVALGEIRRLRVHGLRCPEDVSVVGFNDRPYAEDFWPPLTTVHMSPREIGAEAARLLLHGIESREQEPATLTLRCR